MTALQDVERKIDALDPSIFVLESQTSTNDRTSLLRLQRFVRQQTSDYCYFEIGSHLGGSLLPHLADSRCGWAISVDPRPQVLEDERPESIIYDQNSTQRMIEGLRARLPETSLRKLQTFDLDASAVPQAEVARKVQFLLIDGVHTNVATFSDFMSVYPLLADDAVIGFHDSNLISGAIQNIERFLAYAGVTSRTVFLPDVVAAIGIGAMAEALVEAVGSVAVDRATFTVEANRALELLITKAVLLRGEDRRIILRAAAARISYGAMYRVSGLANRLRPSARQ